MSEITYEKICQKWGFRIEDLAKHLEVPDLSEDVPFLNPFSVLTADEQDFVMAYLEKNNIVITG